MEEMFRSPTTGSLTFDEVFKRLTDYIQAELDYDYHIIVGTDSLLADRTTFITAIVVHRVGRGGIYFYRKRKDRHIDSLRHRILTETSFSLELAHELAEKFRENGYSDLPIEIHLDVGVNGETKNVIREVVGMVEGSGYTPVTKPGSIAASHIADKHTR